MYMMYGVYTAFVLFEQMTQQLLGIDDTSPQFHKLTSGFDNKSFQVDKGLFELGETGSGAGAQGYASCKTPGEKMKRRARSRPEGPEFLKTFDDFHGEGGRSGGWSAWQRSTYRTWLEDPTPPST